MPAWLIVILALTVIAVAFVARPPRALGVLIAVMLLVPDTLLVPGMALRYPWSLVTINRAVVFAFAAGVVVKVITGRLSPGVLRPSRVHVVFLVYLLVTTVNGVALAALDIPVQTLAGRLLLVGDQFLVFAGVLAVLRSSPDLSKAARPWIAVIAAVAIVALVEKVTERSFAEWVAREVNNTVSRIRPALEERGGAVRVRVSFQFALALAWSGAMLLPLLIREVARGQGLRRGLGIAAVASIGLAILFTVSRSVGVGIAVGVGVYALGARDRRLIRLVPILAVIAAGAVLVQPSLLAPFESTRESSGSAQSRVDRLALVTQSVADTPYDGLGLGGLQVEGLRSTDTTYLLTYAEIGVIGLLALVVLLSTLALSVGAGLRAPPGPTGSLAAAALGGTVVGITGAFAFDLFSLPASSQLFWSIAALGVAAAERTRLPARAVQAKRSPTRVLLPVGGALIGLGLFVLAPEHSAVSYRFETLQTATVARAADPIEFVGRVLVRSSCAAADRAAPRATAVTCRPVRGIVGLGEIRVEAASPAEAKQAAEATTAALERAVDSAHPLLPIEPVSTARPTYARTAPVWGGLLGLALALLLPVQALRFPRPNRAGSRRRALAPQPA